MIVQSFCARDGRHVDDEAYCLSAQLLVQWEVGEELLKTVSL